MAPAQDGNTVRVHYTGTIYGGEPFDSSHGREPLEFELGSGQVVRGFEEALYGMLPGDSTTVTFPPELGHGPYMEELVLVVERDQLSSDLDLAVGQRILVRPRKQMFTAVVRDLSATTVTLDGNHPLAGKHLTFEIRLIDVLWAREGQDS